MQVDKVAKFAVDDPFDEAVAVLELDAEDGVGIVHGVDAIGHAETEMVEQDGDASTLCLVAFHGHLEQEDWQDTGLKLLGQVEVDGTRLCLLAFGLLGLAHLFLELSPSRLCLLGTAAAGSVGRGGLVLVLVGTKHDLGDGAQLLSVG